jgi:multiple sugar transport system substrate-binding protein
MKHDTSLSTFIEHAAQGRLTRRDLIRAGAALGLSVPVLSSSYQQTAAQEDVTFWYATNPSETDFAKAVVDAWNASQTTQVDAQPVPAGNSTEEVVLAAIAGGTTPCVLANLAPAAVPQFGQGLVNLSAEFDDADSFLNKRSGKEVVDQYRAADGSLSQVPWKVNPVMVFYNKTMFETAGLDPETPPRTYSEALEAMAKLKEAGITAIQPSIDQTWYNRWFDWYPLYLAAGNQLLLNPEGTEAIFNNDAGKAAMNFWREVYANEYAPKATAQQDSYSQGDVAMRIAGPWAIPDLQSGGVDQESAVMPVWVPDEAPASDTFPNTFADTKNIGIFSNCDNMPDAWSFTKNYVSPENDVMFFQMTQQIPLRTGIDKLMPADFFEQNPMLQPFSQQAEHTLNVDANPKLVDIFNAISLAYQSGAIYAEESVDDALAGAEEEVNSLIGG